jgi:putative transposase
MGFMVKINLKKREKDRLAVFVRKGNKSARSLTRARILLLVDQGKKDVEIQNLLAVGRSTIWRVRNNYFNKGIEYALTERDRPGQPKKYDKKQKVEIIAKACTTPPEGRKRWTVRLLAEEMSTQEGFSTINRETIRLTLKKTTRNHG